MTLENDVYIPPEKLVEKQEDKQTKTDKFLDFFEARIKEDREATFFVFMTALSKDSDDPQNMFLRGDSSIGKTWVVTHTLSIFKGDQNVLMLGGLSPTSLVHDYGVFVNKNDEEVDFAEKPNYKILKEEMKLDPKATIKYIKGKYHELLKVWNKKMSEGHYKVDMHNKLLVFLEAPHIETFNKLRPILSHDAPEISYKFTDKSGSGPMRTSHVVISGWPATIFCTTDKVWLEDLATRSLTITPNVTEKKIRAGCELVGEDFAFPINDMEETNRNRIGLELDCWQTKILENKVKVSIPYAVEIAKLSPFSKPRIMRDLRHILAFIKMNALFNLNKRPKIMCGENEVVVLAIYEDFETVMNFFKYCEETTMTGLNAHMIDFFHKVVEPLGVTNYTQLVETCKTVLNKSLSRNTMYVYIHELSKVGYVDEGPDPDDKRKSIIQVIKRPEKALYSLISEFNDIFKLETFKEFLKKYLEIHYKNSDLSKLFFSFFPSKEEIVIPKDRWSNDVEEFFNYFYLPKIEEKNTCIDSTENRTFISLQKQDKSMKKLTEYTPNSDIIQTNGSLEKKEKKHRVIQEQLKIMLDLVDELSRSDGLASKEKIFGVMKKKHGVPPENCETLLWGLQRNGKIFCPKEGFYKKI